MTAGCWETSGKSNNQSVEFPHRSLRSHLPWVNISSHEILSMNYLKVVKTSPIWRIFAGYSIGFRQLCSSDPSMNSFVV
ncbi:hypothetical protein KIN20_032381 [Parelaphostrongylus tenuis]|uniref:Uncharacterized protein n=1 Tax=Parelaphostrongylus tenuis TaxID=148309 RepID=A0AAD5WIG1_PARTN|nr:hypothetical protein KIN20_032381 [Parelaphostrongylus tenuis]